MVQPVHGCAVVCQPSSPNSFVNLSCTSRSFLLTVGLCLDRTFSKSAVEIGGGRIYVQNRTHLCCLRAVRPGSPLSLSLSLLTLQWKNGPSCVCYLRSEAFGCKLLHGGLHGARLLRSTWHPHVTVRLEEEHGVLRFAHGFKQHVLNLYEGKKMYQISLLSTM